MSLFLASLVVCLLVAVVTGLCILVGLCLLPFRKTRAFGLYALFTEPGLVAGACCAIWLFLQFSARWLHPHSQIFAAILLGLGLLVLTIGAFFGVVAGLALATWLWWKFFPDPYKPIVVRRYRKFVSMPPPFRPRWGSHRGDQAWPPPLS